MADINTQMINSSVLQAQSTPTSPSHPSGQVQPPLEFVINPVIANYSGGSLHNGSLSVNNNNSLSNQIIYRNNGNTAESLPPSPQSQHSCFNSPQGSPGPISISPQDVNPFTTNLGASSAVNYDQMHKKFDQINLDASLTQASYGNYTVTNMQQQQQQPSSNSPNYGGSFSPGGPHIALTSPPALKNHKQSNDGGSPGGPQQNGMVNDNGMNMNNGSPNSGGGGANPHAHTNGGHMMNGNNGNGVGGDIGANDQHSPSNNTNHGSRSGSLSSTGSGVGLNQLANGNNGQIEDINIQNMINYQQSPPPVSNNSLGAPNGNHQPSNHPLSSKTHKNSIPNIILTFSGGKHPLITPYSFFSFLKSISKTFNLFQIRSKRRTI